MSDCTCGTCPEGFFTCEGVLSFHEWVANHKLNPEDLRLGQRFVNEYRMEELNLYFLDDQTAAAVIERMLKELHYWPLMPTKK